MDLANEEYGIEVEKVSTIERMMPITRVPKTPAFIKGVINLRGSLLPIIDLARPIWSARSRADRKLADHHRCCE